MKEKKSDNYYAHTPFKKTSRKVEAGRLRKALIVRPLGRLDPPLVRGGRRRRIAGIRIPSLGG